MNIEKRTKREIVNKEYKVYIAFDGKEFPTYGECQAYETNAKMRSIEHLEIKNMRNYMPLTWDSDPGVCSKYEWYEVKNEDDVELLSEAYGECIYVNQYPEIVCIETTEGDEEVYQYTMNGIRANVRRFFEKLGYRITFEKIDEQQ